jgi:hypothetical protein
MNASRLKEIVDILLDCERDLRIHEAMRQTLTRFDDVVLRPGSLQTQEEFLRALEALGEKYRRLHSKLTPGQARSLSDLNGSALLLQNAEDIIRESLRERVGALSLTRNDIHVLCEALGPFLDKLRELSGALAYLGVEKEALRCGEAEIGFVLPEDPFKNRPDRLIGELAEIKFIIRAFSELATGAVEPVEVRTISTSDPQFFFKLSAPTIALIGGAANWALDRRRQLEEIRKFREDARKIPGLDDDDLEAALGKRVKALSTDAVRDYAGHLLNRRELRVTRAQEQREKMEDALQSILTRVENGMSVEIRFLPPAMNDHEDKKRLFGKAMTLEKLREISDSLVFPLADANPIVWLPGVERRAS